MADAGLTFDVLARDRASSTFNRIGRSTDSLNKRMGTLSRTARVALGGFAAFEAAKAIRAIAGIGIAYQDSLNVFQSVSRATAAQMDQVAAKAKALGANLTLPTTSAADAAAAMTELAKGGLSVRQSMQAALGTLQLATAAQVDGAQAAQIQSAALAQFGLNGKAAGHVADLLANAANAAQGEITDMATALSYVGPIARGAGVNIDDTATAISVLAKNGILGEKAGTGLRGMIVSLQKPTAQAKVALKALSVQAFDSQGHFVGLRSVIEQLHAAQGRFTEQGFANALASSFGRQNLAAITALVGGGTQEFDHFAKAVERTGGAAKVAEARSKGLGGAMRGLKSQLETLAIDLYGKVAPGLERVVRAISDHLPGAIRSVQEGFARARPDLVAFAHNAESFGRAFAEALRSMKPVAEFVGGILLTAFRSLSALMGRLGSAPDTVKTLTRMAVAGVVAWKAYTLWARASAGATALFGRSAVAATGEVTGLSAALARVALIGKGGGFGWLAAGAAVSKIPLYGVGANSDVKKPSLSSTVKTAIKEYRDLAQQIQSAALPAEQAQLQSLLAVYGQFLRTNGVMQVNIELLNGGSQAISTQTNYVRQLYAAWGSATDAASKAGQAIANAQALKHQRLDANVDDRGLVDTAKQAKKHADTAAKRVSGTLGFDIGEAMSKGVEKGISAAATRTIDAARSMVDKINEKFRSLRDSARELARSIADTMRGAADLTNISQADSLGSAMAPTVASIRSFLDDQLKNDRQFRRLLKREHARGLSDALYRQLAQAGPQAAGPIVQALAGASGADLRHISRTNRSIGALGRGFGANVAQDQYGARLRDAARDRKEANRLLHELIRAVKSDDKFTAKDAHRMGREFRQAIAHLRVVTDTGKQDHKQGQRVLAG